MCKKFVHSSFGLPLAGSTTPSEQMHWPLHLYASSGHRLEFGAADSPPSCRQTGSLEGSIYSWLSQRWCTRQQLESLIGHLHRVTRVVWPERSFLRRMINLLCSFRRRDHLIRLYREFHLDLHWWHELLTIWHGVSFDLILNVDSHRFKGHLRCCRLLGLRGLLSRAVVLGFRIRLNGRLHIKISSLLWWHLSHGVLRGSGNILCFTLTMRLWFTCWRPKFPFSRLSLTAKGSYGN